MVARRERSVKYTPKVTICLFVLFVSSPYAKPVSRGIPTPEQMAWHEMEIEMFLCLDPCTWQGREYDNHSIALSNINPAELDTDQWCEVAQSFHAKQILFVAKHTGGFWWWQTETSDYSIKNTAYKDGKGDVLAELARSCKKYGLKLGVYIYPGDDQWGAGIGSGGRTKDPSKQQAYNKVLRQQWTEVLTRYGEISEVWFDGSCIIEVGDILRKRAPKAMVFQGPHATLRWPGNEKGIAPYPTWQTVKRADADSGVSTGRHSDPDGDVWLPMEMDTTLLDHKWFWGPDTDSMIKTLDHLTDIYYKSVGRGCVLLLNATPDTSGLIPESHVTRYREFGRAIAGIYKHKVGQIKGSGMVHEIRWAGPEQINHIITMEDIRYGQIIRAYEVQGLVNNKWEKLISGSSVGYKKTDVMNTIGLEGLRLKVTQAVGRPVIRSFAAYYVAKEDNQISNDKHQEARWSQVTEWKTAKLSRKSQVFNIDLTPYIRTPGQYEVEFRKKGGAARLDVENAVVVMAGTPAPRLIKKLDRPNAWNINRTAQVTESPEGGTSLRIIARSSGKGIWEGEMYIRSAE